MLKVPVAVVEVCLGCGGIELWQGAVDLNQGLPNDGPWAKSSLLIVFVFAQSMR